MTKMRDERRYAKEFLQSDKNLWQALCPALVDVKQISLVGQKTSNDGQGIRRQRNRCVPVSDLLCRRIGFHRMRFHLRTAKEVLPAGILININRSFETVYAI